MHTEFISKAIAKHGNNYDYSKVKYVNCKTKIDIVCRKHGIFSQRPKEHIYGAGCPSCAREVSNSVIGSATGPKLTKKARNAFVEKANTVHGSRYDYSEVEYLGCKHKVKIRCPEHGVFLQTPNLHLYGNGCPECAKLTRANENRITTEEFIAAAREVHGDKYDYSKVKYVHHKKLVTIICPAHGEFRQAPNGHLYNSKGCSRCNDSKGEKYISNWLQERGIEYRREIAIPEFNPRKRFDYYISSLDIYIEYDGEQHFKPINNRHQALLAQKERDIARNNWCKHHGIKLAVVTYLDDKDKLLNSIISGNYFRS